MFESFIIMVREGIEAALVIGILLAVLKQSGRRSLERPVYWGIGLAVLASVGAAFALQSLPINEEFYEGVLYLTSAAFVLSMMIWMHRTAKTLRTQIQRRVQGTSEYSRRAAWGLGAFAFLMIFREGAETVMFLSAVSLTTDAILSVIGALAGLAVAVVFAVLFVRGSLRVDLRRFFQVTEWVLGIFVAQLIVNGYHEFAEIGILPATQRSMALVGPIVRNNSLFILAIATLPLIIWFSRPKKKAVTHAEQTAAERRLMLAAARRERNTGYLTVATTLIVLVAIGVVYAREALPKAVPMPEMIMAEGDTVVIPTAQIEEGVLHRFGFATKDRVVRFLVMRTSDGRTRTTLDACDICGSFGYVQDAPHLICLNCSAEINPMTLGAEGGCNPIPLEAEVTDAGVHIRVENLIQQALLFPPVEQTSGTAMDPICDMQVRIDDAAAVEVVDNTTYYFCNERCRVIFNEDRAKR